MNAKVLTDNTLTDLRSRRRHRGGRRRQAEEDDRRGCQHPQGSVELGLSSAFTAHFFSSWADIISYHLAGMLRLHKTRPQEDGRQNPVRPRQVPSSVPCHVCASQRGHYPGTSTRPQHEHLSKELTPCRLPLTARIRGDRVGYWCRRPGQQPSASPGHHDEERVRVLDAQPGTSLPCAHQYDLV